MEINSTISCQTIYPSRENFSNAIMNALAGGNILVAITNISLNAFLIYALSTTKQLRKLSSRLILYLSLSDCCVGAVLQPIVTVILLRYKNERNCSIELLAQFIALTFAQFSGVQIMIIAIDRFLRMKYLNQHRKYMTRRRAALMVFCNGCLSIGFAVSSVVAGVHEQFYIFNVVLASIDSFIVVMIFVIYTFTYLSVHHHISQARKREKQRNNEVKLSKMSKTSKISNSSVAASKPKARADSALAKTMVFILASLAICYVPYLVLGVTWTYLRFEKATVSRKFMSTLAALTWWSFILVHLNSSINALIFVTRNTKTMQLLRTVTSRSKNVSETTPSTSELSIDSTDR